MKLHPEIPEHNHIINIASNSENLTEALLSNLAHTPFILNGKQYSSVEGFWQGLKYGKEADRARVADFYGIKSKIIGNEGDNKEGTFEYFGKIYTVGSFEHQELMYWAIRAKLEQNPDVLKLLLATGNAKIIHEPKKKDGTPYPDSETIPASIFSGFLMKLRDELALTKVNGIQKRASEASQNLTQRMEEEKQTYLNSKSEEFKQDYWDKQICSSWWHSYEEDFPINFSEYRQHHLHIEPNLDRFIPGMMAALEDLGFSGTLEDIFILDETAEHYLRVHSLTASNSQAVGGIISQTEQQFSELAEKIGDLFYDGLADVFEGLSQTTTPTASIQIIKAKQHASTAWEICKPYISEKTNPKHKTNVAGMDNKILGNRIGKLDNNTLKSLLELLGNKIHIDGLADQGRGRKKLATELFSCSESLLNASKEL